MKRYCVSGLSLFGIGIFAVTMWSQTSKPNVSIELRTISDKETYALKESIMVKSELTNLSTKVLCFPRPSQVCEDSALGYLVTKGIPPAGARDTDQFVCHTDGGGTWPREKLILEIKQKWIKLAPGKQYVTETIHVPIDLTAAGQWQLETTYHPPEGAFQPTKFRDYLNSAAKEAGCWVPQGKVIAEPISITAVQKTEKD